MGRLDTAPYGWDADKWERQRDYHAEQLDRVQAIQRERYPGTTLCSTSATR